MTTSMTRVRSVLATLVACALVVTVSPAQLAEAAPRNPEPAGTVLRDTRVVAVGTGGAGRATREPARAAKAAWPRAEPQVEVGSVGRGDARRLGPVGVRAAASSRRAPGSVKLAVLDRQASQASVGAGVVFTVAGEADATVSVDVDYSSFADAVGGGWSSRLTLVGLPACALTTPTREECRTQTPVATVNDVAGRRLQADVALTGGVMVMAATASGSGGGGDFGATSLAASSTWAAGGSGGAFTWSYPLRVVPVPGGLAPELSVSYSSAVADGRTAGSNNQSSWLGEGFDLGSGFIERRYVPCVDEVGTSGAGNTVKTGDLCWWSDPEVTHEAPWDNAVLNLAGHSGVLVRESGDVWRLDSDDGTRIEKLGTVASGESWRVTTTDGTQYFFGVGSVAGSSEPTNSRWSVPVAGNHVGEPGKAATFAGSFTSVGWRWNLDYVVSPAGRTITYRYAVETNKYKKNLTTLTGYDRGGYLAEIRYGMASGQAGVSPPARVVFRTDERCVNDATLLDCAGATPSVANASHWPDVPVDAICVDGNCTSALVSPSFFTRRKLAGVDTYAGSTLVDTWTFETTFPATGDSSDATLWLAGITHVGGSGSGAVALPKVMLTAAMMRNRATGNQFGTPLTRARLAQIVTESGGKTIVAYSPEACDLGALPDPESNTSRCFPAFYSDETTTTPTMEWFNKYVVQTVLQQDVAQQVNPVTGVSGSDAIPIRTSYEYASAAWHFDDTPITQDRYRTWSQWRGYRTVRTIVGDAGTPKQATETTYFQGMDGDRLASGTRSVTVTDAFGGSHADVNALAGQALQQRQLVAVGGAADSTTVTTPWISSASADDGRTASVKTGIAKTVTQQVLAAGGVRTTESSVVTRDGDGFPTKTQDLGDVAIPGDDQCTWTTYASNPAAGIFGLPASKRVGPGSCAVAPSEATLLSGSRTYYDANTALDAAPTKGLPTRVENLVQTGGQRAWVTAATTTYDTYGQPVTVTDVLGRTVATEYDTTGGLTTVTRVRTPDPDGNGPASVQTATTTLDPRWGKAVKFVAAAGQTTEADLDALGRVVGSWLPGRARSQTASSKYTYSINANASGVNWIKTETLNGDGSTYSYGYEIYDSLMRPRQTQTQSLDGATGRVIRDTLYDARGLATHQMMYVNTTTNPQGVLVAPAAANDVPQLTSTTYDTLGRATATSLTQYGTLQWSSTIGYGGDRTTTTPPAGGTPTTTVTDARGHTTALIQHLGSGADAATSTTSYTYDVAGRLTAMTDPTGKNTWTWGYDLQGNVVSSSDPDRGTTTSTFDVAGRVLTTTDARGKGVAYTYDQLDRVTKTATLGGATLTTATFDPTTGLATTSSRWIGAQQLTTTVDSYDTAARPTQTTTTVPAVTGLIDSRLAGSYTTTVSYRADGSIASQTLPAAGNLPAETLSYGYTTRNLPNTLTGTVSGTTTKYAASTGYTPLGELAWITMGTGSGLIQQKYFYQPGSRRLDLTKIAKANGTLESTTIGYDPAGNVTSLAAVPATGATDTQCFTYDTQQQLTQAWTPASGACAAAPSQAALGGIAPYWTTWTLDTVGRITTRTSRTTTTSTTTSFAFNADGQPQPHFVTGTTATGTTPGTATYASDVTGNTTSRPGQTLAWDDEGHLASITSGGTVLQTLVYDATGQRVLRRETGRTTLTVAGAEITLTTAGALTAQRYYPWAGKTIGVRTGATTDTVTHLVPDHHNTTHYQVQATTGTTRIVWTAPYGVTRTQPAGWAGEAAFVGGRTDPTVGLVHIGAREYDTTLNRFLSVDPILALQDPISHHNYTYANNTPVTRADPTGLRPDDYTPQMWQAELNALSRGATPLQATQAAFNTPSGKAGGNTWSGRQGISESLLRSAGLSSYESAVQQYRASLYWHSQPIVPGPPSFRERYGPLADNASGLAALVGIVFLPEIIGYVAINAGAVAIGITDATAGGSFASTIAGGVAVGVGKAAAGTAAANPVAKMPRLLRVGDVKLPAVANGAVGMPVKTGKGLEYVIPRGTPEIDPRVTSVRIMDPVTSGKYQYPNGYAVYMNEAGQTANPLTGQTIGPSHPFSHIEVP